MNKPKIIFSRDEMQKLNTEKLLERGVKIEDIALIKFDSKDVVRHPLVQRIVKAYDEYESKRHV